MDSFSAPGAVTVYVRPGCPYCVSLRRRLRRSGVHFDEVDIWQDPEAAAFVRSVAGGNETVPTVVVGDHALVNPAARQVLQLAGGAGEGEMRRRWMGRWLQRQVR